MKTVVYALHGFLGLSSDWAQVEKKIKEEKPDWDFVTPSLFQDQAFSSIQSFEKFVLDFYKWQKDFEGNAYPQGDLCRALVGYSLGGRLALHLLEANPDHWSSAVLISTHPGLVTKEEKNQRIESDKAWAGKFLNGNFSATIQEWNDQATLRGSFEPSRKEENYLKKDLAEALTVWSLGHQKNFRLLMDLWHVRQLWIAGENDQKFSDLLKTLPESGDIQRWMVEGASHRLIFEAPEEVAHFIIRGSSPIKFPQVEE